MPKLSKSVLPFHVSVLTHSIFFSIYEESGGHGHQNRPPDEAQPPSLSPPLSPPCFSTLPCMTPHSILCSVSAPLSTTRLAVDHSSTRTSAFPPQRVGGFRWHLWRGVDVLISRNAISFRDVGRKGPIPPTRLKLATRFAPSLAIDLSKRVLERPLAPAISPRLHHLWCSSRRCASRTARRSHGCICGLCGPSPYRRVGPWERGRVQHCRGVLPPDGPWRQHGGCLRKGYRHTRAGISRLVMDNVVDPLVGHTHA
jgi:hypothetical protein